MYKGKTIAVFCTSKRLEHEIDYLADIAATVYLIPMYKDVEINRENVEIIRKMPQKIDGTKRVEKITFAGVSSQNTPKEIAVDGVFMLRDCVSPAVLVGGLQM